MRYLRPLLALALTALLDTAYADTSVTVETLPTRPGVTQRFVLLTPEHPRASLILFTGGPGVLEIPDTLDPGWHPENFLVRTRGAWAAEGFQVAVVDAPSDHLPGGLGRFRESPEHAEDIAAVIGFLKQRAAVPVWLVGTSRGTTSAAAVAIRQADRQLVDGVVLTSTILKGEGNVSAMDLAQLKVPTLVIHHRDDGCRSTPYGQVSQLMERLHTPASSLITIEGGSSSGDECQPWAHHGYNGVEDSVVHQASDWIKAHSPG